MLNRVLYDHESSLPTGPALNPRTHDRPLPNPQTGGQNVNTQNLGRTAEPFYV